MFLYWNSLADCQIQMFRILRSLNYRMCNFSLIGQNSKTIEPKPFKLYINDPCIKIGQSAILSHLHGHFSRVLNISIPEISFLNEHVGNARSVQSVIKLVASLRK